MLRKTVIAIFLLITVVTAQTLDSQTQTATPHDAAIAMGVLPFSISSMKTEAVVLTDELLSNAANSASTQQIFGRSAFANPNAVTNTDSLLQKVIQPPQRQDFKLNGDVAYLETFRSRVEQNFGAWQPTGFYDVNKLIFGENGYLIAQKGYYYPEQIPIPVTEETGNWLSRIFRLGRTQADTEMVEDQNDWDSRKIEGCYSLKIDFSGQGFDCFDSEDRILYVREWDSTGRMLKEDRYHLGTVASNEARLNEDWLNEDWIEKHIHRDYLSNTRIERYYDLTANLIEFKSFDGLQDLASINEHFRYFYNDSGQRVTEAVLDSGRAIACKFLVYGQLGTLEEINSYTIRQTNQQNNSELSNEVSTDAQAAFRSTLTQQSYTCEKEIPSILIKESSTVMDYGWLYDNNDQLAGRRKQEINHYDAQGNLKERTIFSYFETMPTSLAAINNYDGQGRAVASIDFEYDKQGRLVKEERWQYDDNGEATRVLEQSDYIYKAKESTLLEKTIEDYEHSRSKSIQNFDDSGNLIREQKFELFNRFGILNNIFRKKSDVSQVYTGRSFVAEMQEEIGNNKKHESYTYVFDYAQNLDIIQDTTILNWIQKDEGSRVDKFDSSYAEPHHTVARRICYYPDVANLDNSLICNSPFD